MSGHFCFVRCNVKRYASVTNKICNNNSMRWHSNNAAMNESKGKWIKVCCLPKCMII